MRISILLPWFPIPRVDRREMQALERGEDRAPTLTYLLAIQPADTSFPEMSHVTLPEDTQT